MNIRKKLFTKGKYLLILLGVFFPLHFSFAFPFDNINQGFGGIKGVFRTVDVHGVCKKVQNNRSDYNIFIPTKTADEWSRFQSSISGLNVTLESCCDGIAVFHGGLWYYGITGEDGRCWLDRDYGATIADASSGTKIAANQRYLACPAGWHLPSQAEFDVLHTALDNAFPGYNHAQSWTSSKLKLSWLGWGCNGYAEHSKYWTNEPANLTQSTAYYDQNSWQHWNYGDYVGGTGTYDGGCRSCSTIHPYLCPPAGPDVRARCIRDY